ncbi:hypothetical protein [Sphaerisporangium aureirubrum]|uniref:Uncharacterized protein n=1 Tax=Sphaerisporangium aureirubrum TaxID=1544736 RepID=A0ABW1NK14_9ACTN
MAEAIRAAGGLPVQPPAGSSLERTFATFLWVIMLSPEAETRAVTRYMDLASLIAHLGGVGADVVYADAGVVATVAEATVVANVTFTETATVVDELVVEKRKGLTRAQRRRLCQFHVLEHEQQPDGQSR